MSSEIPRDFYVHQGAASLAGNTPSNIGFTDLFEIVSETDILPIPVEDLCRYAEFARGFVRLHPAENSQAMSSSTWIGRKIIQVYQVVERGKERLHPRGYSFNNQAIVVQTVRHVESIFKHRMRYPFHALRTLHRTYSDVRDALVCALPVEEDVTVSQVLTRIGSHLDQINKYIVDSSTLIREAEEIMKQNQFKYFSELKGACRVIGKMMESYWGENSQPAKEYSQQTDAMIQQCALENAVGRLEEVQKLFNWVGQKLVDLKHATWVDPECHGVGLNLKGAHCRLVPSDVAMILEKLNRVDREFLEKRKEIFDKVLSHSEQA